MALHHKIALGTAGFGMDYGVTNNHGQASQKEITSILKTAIAYNPHIIIDTAPGYGNSENVLGAVSPLIQQAKIITKTDIENENITEAYEQSLQKLKQKKVYALLDHNASHLKSSHGKECYAQMKDLKDRRRVQKIGASVYTASDIDFLLEHYEIDIVQIPLNILDQRLITSGHIKALKQRSVEIHARSVFLQGTLLARPDDLPDFLVPYQEYFEQFYNFCRSRNCTQAEACVDFMATLKDIDAIVIGVNTAAEFKAHIAPTSIEGAQEHYSHLSCTENFVLNPAQWPARV